VATRIMTAILLAAVVVPMSAQSNLSLKVSGERSNLSFQTRRPAGGIHSTPFRRVRTLGSSQN
jgi:hypothetical protein